MLLLPRQVTGVWLITRGLETSLILLEAQIVPLVLIYDLIEKTE